MRSGRSDGAFSIGSDVWPGVSKLIEEIGELGQVLGKLIATHGAREHWDGSDLLDRLHDEIADVGAALVFVQQANGLDPDRIAGRAEAKLQLFHRWQREQLPGDGHPRPPVDRNPMPAFDLFPRLAWVARQLRPDFGWWQSVRY